MSAQVRNIAEDEPAQIDLRGSLSVVTSDDEPVAGFVSLTLAHEEQIILRTELEPSQKEELRRIIEREGKGIAYRFMEEIEDVRAHNTPQPKAQFARDHIVPPLKTVTIVATRFGVSPGLDGAIVVPEGKFPVLVGMAAVIASEVHNNFKSAISEFAARHNLTLAQDDRPVYSGPIPPNVNLAGVKIFPAFRS